MDAQSTSAIAGSTAAGGNYGGTVIANYNYSGETKCTGPSTQCLTASQFAKVTNISSSGPRNGFRGPGYVSTDLSVTKSIPVHWEGGTLSLGVQAFNVLNHPNFKVPNATSLTASNFGTISATVNPTGIFSGVGGDDSPRILQVRMKLVF
jgi:hypothetical protein